MAKVNTLSEMNLMSMLSRIVLFCSWLFKLDHFKISYILSQFYMYNLGRIAELSSPSVTTTLNVNSAKLPDPSTNRYVTAVDPTMKNCPGEWVLEARLTVPELSMAIGSLYWAMIPPRVRPTSASTQLQPWMTGCVLSTANWNKMDFTMNF